MARRDPAVEAHLEWIGFVRPTGLVVSAPALVRAGAVLNAHDREGQDRLASCTVALATPEAVVHSLPDFRHFADKVLGWSFSSKGYAGTDERPVPDELTVHLPDFGETLKPDVAVIERSPDEGEVPWQLLVRVLDVGTDFDAHEAVAGSTLDASPHGRMERLLRQTGVYAGLIFNGSALRLISAPRGESSGWLDFQVEEMVQTAGRPICAAMRLLLSERRLLSLPKEERLSALLLDSRAFQNEVSVKLAEQVMHALYELVRGLQAAHDQSKGELLRDVLRQEPDEVYRSLLTVILRIVFLLYAEEREMLPSDDVFMRFYRIAGLHERLREDAAHYPDTLDQRYGAWAQLLGLFRMVYDGAELHSASLPKRHGVLFDPDRFPFLEGRSGAGIRQIGERIAPPLVPDGTVYRVLERLLILDGERISYRALDVEQIGSVYETMMGFRLETAMGRSLAIRSNGRGGAPTTVDLDELLKVQPSKRRKWLQDLTERKISASVSDGIKDAATLEQLHAALRPVTDRRATPDLVPRGAMILQPSEERRKSGSHYTPRALTEPIVRKTLEPLLARLAGGTGGVPTPEQILELRICDPAMGSGAFLVETCRQLGDALLDAWKAGDGVPTIPPDEDEVVFARRRVAQRCLYGVDRNPIAVDLAKVSLWLVTLAREHAFTFLDHALRHGDSLVGLSRRQIELFHWDTKSPSARIGIETGKVRDHVDRALNLRRQINDAGEDVEDWELRALWDEAEAELSRVRLFGDLVIAAYFDGSKGGEREARRAAYADDVLAGKAEYHRDAMQQMRLSDTPLVPFHWDVEFSEVFQREDGGFDGFVGNPPFLKGHFISRHFGGAYRDFLTEVLVGATCGLADLVSFFFVRAFELMRSRAATTFVATNSIADGDTNRIGVETILERGARLTFVESDLTWPGAAGVVVTLVGFVRGVITQQPVLERREVDVISADFRDRVLGDPLPLAANADLCFVGSYVNGDGFILDSEEAQSLIRQRSEYAEVVLPYIGGSELYHFPDQLPRRFAICFWDWSAPLAEERFPRLFSHLKDTVKPYRDTVKRKRTRENWWLHAENRPGLYHALGFGNRFMRHPEDWQARGQAGIAIIKAKTSSTWAFVRVADQILFDQSLAVIVDDRWTMFSVLQSSVHQIWAWQFGSTLKRDPSYTPSTVFETFPFPRSSLPEDAMEGVGRRYHDFRAGLMVRASEGLTATYNRFNDPGEQDSEIAQLRTLQEEMDRAVLAAYDWDDIPIACDFFPDNEVEEEGSNSHGRKVWRYRWPDGVHDEVLARLLRLNHQRAEEERMGAGALMRKVHPGMRAKATGASQNELFAE